MQLPVGRLDFIMSKIASLTVVNQQGSKLFSIGMEVNNLKLHEIKDESESESEFDSETFFVSIYRGYTCPCCGREN